MVVARPSVLQLAKMNGFEQLKRHFLRQTTLVQTAGRAYHDH